jgi:hypothetical protein
MSHLDLVFHSLTFLLWELGSALGKCKGFDLVLIR